MKFDHKITIHVQKEDEDSITTIVNQLEEFGFKDIKRAHAVRMGLRFLAKGLSQKKTYPTINLLTSCLDSSPRT